MLLEIGLLCVAVILPFFVAEASNLKPSREFKSGKAYRSQCENDLTTEGSFQCEGSCSLRDEMYGDAVDNEARSYRHST